MCTAFSYCRVCQQRLRGFGTYAPNLPGSSGVGPWALRPKRLQWLTNITTGFKIAALCQAHMHLSEKSNNFSGACDRASSLKANIPPSTSICGLEASGGHSPPLSFTLSRPP